MTIATARALIQAHARNGDTYTATQLDYAIIDIGNDFVNRTRCTRTAASINTVADTSALSFSSVTNFRPDRLIKMWYATDFESGIQVVEHLDVLALHDHHAAEGVPTHIGFADFTSGVLYPTPDAIYALAYTWTPPFTVYTPGQATTSTVLNIPDDLIYPVMRFGGVANVQQTMIELQGMVSAERKGYEEHVRRTIGTMANLGAQTSIRTRIAEW
jgi:hypothetical protein